MGKWGRDEATAATSGGITARVRGEVRQGFYHIAFAWLLSHGEGADRRAYGERKRAFLSDLRGTVVDVGAGAGVNLSYLDPAVRYVAVEPNVHFHRRIRRKAKRAGIKAEVMAGVAERLPLPDASADAVLSTLVLCSVDDVARSLAEVQRVLKPGGRFVFVEHVAAPRGTALRAAQRLLRAPWGLIADGCRPDRETARMIDSAGFTDLATEKFTVPVFPISPHVIGSARKVG